MKFVNNFILIVFCISFLNSCQKDNKSSNDSSPKYNSELTANSEVLKLPLDADTPPKSICLKYFSPNENEEYLFFLNKHINTILIFDLNKRKLIRKIPIQKEGEDGIGRASGFTIKNLDSIYVASSGKTILYLIDSYGLIKRKIDYGDPVGNLVPSYSRLSSKYNKDVIFWKDKLLLSQPLYVNGRKPTKELLKNHRMYLGIDPESHTHQFFPITPPEDYFEKGHFTIASYSIVFDGEKVVCSYLNDHSLYFSTDVQVAKKVIAKTRFIDEFVPLDNVTNPFGYYAENPNYGSIFYDPYREVFYRFAKHALTPDQLKETGEMQAYNFPPRFSVLILDKDLHVLGETPFFGNNYNMFNSFVGRKGLYISIANPLRPDFSEDFLRFELFELTRS